jgi:hypothetical protein
MHKEIWIPGMVLSAAALAAVVLTGVGMGCGDDCAGTYNCPALFGSAELVVPSNLTSPLVSVTIDGPCKTNFAPGDNEAPLTLMLKENPPSKDFTCTVHGRLADGTDLLATIEFKQLKCCGVAGAPGPITFGPTR